MSSNNSSTDTPGSAAGQTPPTGDNAPSSSASGPALPPPAPMGVENIPGDDEAPATPAQISEDCNNMEAAIKESMEHIERDNDAPVPPAQTAEAYEEAETTIKKSIQQSMSKDVPLPPSQIDALADTERGDDETNAKKKPAPTTERDEGTPPALPAASPPHVRDEAIPTPSLRQQPILIRPMPPSPDEDTVTREPSTPMLEATPVEDRPEAIVVPDLPVYDGVQVAEQTRFEKNKKIIIGVGMGILFGTAVTAGVVVSSNNDSSDSNAINSEGVVLSAARPSESSSPSEIPSLQLTARPSESSSPLDVPSLRPTLRPSQSAKPSQSPSRSLRPSLYPSISASPTPFCFGGEISILTDSYPEETSWTISRIDNVDGVSNSKVVLEGSPEREGLHTFDELCLERGDYEFAIFDSYGDGIVSPGYYSVAFEGVEIAQGGQFESEERVSFSLPLPSPQPSESFSPSKFPSVSFQPSESIIPSQSLSPSLQPSNSFSPSTYWSSLNWSRQGLGFNGDASEDFFGRAVAFSEDASTVAVGAPGKWSNEDRPGYVKVYRREGVGSRWEQRGDTIRGEANGDNFGFSLSLSEDGTDLSIGAPLHDSVGPDSGQVKVYKWDEAELDYVQIGDTLYGAASYDEFGYSLDISDGKILAIGVPASDVNGSDSGQVAVYAWDDASSNFKQRGEAINGDASADWFGFSVLLAGNGQKLAASANLNDSNGNAAGQVKVFEWDEATSSYEQLGDSLLGDAAGDHFGQSVSFSRDGTTLAIGAPFNAKNGVDSGQVRVFAWDEAASNFMQIGQSFYGKAASDYFGLSVALSSEGKTLAIRAPFGEPGYVEVYWWDKAAREYKRLGQSFLVEACCDWFGWAMALAGNGRDLAIGAPYSDRVEVFDIEL